MIGGRVGRYEILALIGEGGMGQVFRGRDVDTGDEAAIKVLQPKFCKVEAIVRRFFNEARAAGSTHHPGIVDVYGAEFTSEKAYIALELIDGEPLSGPLGRDGRFDPGDVMLLGTQIALALAAAHDNGIVHRDLKPDNIMLVDDDEVPGGRRIKILDFGLAKLLDDLGQATIRTNTGVAMGTPSYMAPEQWQPEQGIDHRADIYGLGCVLFHMALGRPPFVYDGFAAKMRAHVSEPPPDPCLLDPDFPPDLAKLLLTMLEKKPAHRYRNMVAVAEALSAVSRGEELPSGPTRATTVPGKKGARVGATDRAEPVDIEIEHSLHPSMPSVPSLRTTTPSRLPMVIIGFVAIAIIGAIVVWRVLG